MIIESKELPPIGTNAFALIQPELKECIIIDAPLDAFDWAQQIAQQHDCKIIALLLTHGHWDHILDAHKFAAAGIPVYGHQADQEMFAAPSKMASYAMPGLTMQAVAITEWIEDSTVLNMLGIEIEVRHVPGHCPGNVLFYLPTEAATFVGDVIFAGSVGRYDLPGGDFATLEQSIKTQVYSLPQNTTIYPGHGPKTSVEHEKATNPIVRA